MFAAAKLRPLSLGDLEYQTGRAKKSADRKPAKRRPIALICWRTLYSSSRVVLQKAQMKKTNA